MKELIKRYEKSLEVEAFDTGYEPYDELLEFKLGDFILVNSFLSDESEKLVDSIACFLNKRHGLKVCLGEEGDINYKRVGYLKNFGGDKTRDYDYVENNFFLIKDTFNRSSNINKNLDFIKKNNCKIVILTNIETLVKESGLTYWCYTLKRLAEMNKLLVIATVEPVTIRTDLSNTYLPPKFYDIEKSFNAIKNVDVVINLDITKTGSWFLDVEKAEKSVKCKTIVK